MSRPRVFWLVDVKVRIFVTGFDKQRGDDLPPECLD